MTTKRFQQVMPAFLESKLQLAANQISNGNRTHALNIIVDMALINWTPEQISKWAKENYDEDSK